VIFASVQSLGRANDLRHFASDAFDYIVIDEFHHASATTYRRLIDHFSPAFMLALTATPDRSDGADLLALCGENLVFTCDVWDGVEQKLLSPFRYFGVPDVVDFNNIPWRSRSFDPAELEAALATAARAQNALEQWRPRKLTRTLGFCVSQRHADFMRDYFVAHGVRCVAVHSGLTEEHQYADEFLSPTELNWVSQNKIGAESKDGIAIREHAQQGITVHLLVRKRRKTQRGGGAPFVYCGPVHFVRSEGSAPMNVSWRLEHGVPEGLFSRAG
jgi:superfamily II DNA or RNA helicase